VPRKRAHRFGCCSTGNVKSNFLSNQIGGRFMAAGSSNHAFLQDAKGSGSGAIRGTHFAAHIRLSEPSPQLLHPIQMMDHESSNL
jgi:hypothetical protein